MTCILTSECKFLFYTASEIETPFEITGENETRGTLLLSLVVVLFGQNIFRI